MLQTYPITALPHTRSLTVQRLRKLGIETYDDLIHHFPFRYQDFSLVAPIATIQEGETVTVHGKVISGKTHITRRGFHLQTITMQDTSGRLTVTWFNQPYVIAMAKPGSFLSVSGTAERVMGKLSIQPEAFEVFPTDDYTAARHTGRLVPVYPETYGLSSKTIREKVAIILALLDEGSEDIPETLPADLVREFGFEGEKNAIMTVHRPRSHQFLERARNRLAFDELFSLQLAAARIRARWNEEKVVNIIKSPPRITKQCGDFIGALPFKLTGDQQRAVDDIYADLLQLRPMNRFLQGDVGSGKTVVAAAAAYLSFLNGYQSLVMAPTEILATQHYRSFRKMFPEKMSIGLITGNTKAAEKKELEKSDIVIGTHALLGRTRDFGKVGLVVIDEQHRFGVSQRANLRNKGIHPHLLSMTATPIPRTVALTMYGELDVSVIAELPPGRKPIRTYVVPQEKRTASERWIADKIRKERIQVFIICPLIDESESETTASVKAARKEFERLQTTVYPELRIGLLHGKMKPDEKNVVMAGFASGSLDILISTSVVEVGIDIPNATIMVIEGAERFGLAQLHQLRGRVGRGTGESFCLLFTQEKAETDTQRLAYFASQSSGLKLAEYDLSKRGAGHIFGTAQHGFMKLKMARWNDLELIQKTKKAVGYYIEHGFLDRDYPVLDKILSGLKKDEIARD